MEIVKLAHELMSTCGDPKHKDNLELAKLLDDGWEIVHINSCLFPRPDRTEIWIVIILKLEG